MNRRDFLRTAGGAAGATAAVSAGAGTAVAQEGNASSGNETSGNETSGGGGGGGSAGPPDLGGYLSDVANYGGSVTDKTGQDEVTVQVGVDNGGNPFGFGPPAVHVDNGATVKWEWTGNGGGHNVVAEDGTFKSGSTVSAAGVNFEYTFKKDGVYQYYCNPHKGSGMKGAIVVGTDYPVAEGGNGEHGPNTDPLHMGVPFQAHWVGIATILMMFVSLIFTFFLLKYGESPHTKGGNS